MQQVNVVKVLPWNNDSTRALVLRKSDGNEDVPQGAIDFIGGRMEKGEDPNDPVHRMNRLQEECLQETGLTLAHTEQVGVSNTTLEIPIPGGVMPLPATIYFYIGTFSEDQPKPTVSKEHTTGHWLTGEEIVAELITRHVPNAAEILDALGLPPQPALN